MKSGPYTLVVPPQGYPGKLYQGQYAYEHRVIFWQTHGFLPEVVHHDNEKKRDNHPRNLIGKSNGVHIAEHNRERRAPDVKLVCAHCGKKFTRAAHDVNWKTAAGQKKFYCSQRCGGLAMSKPLVHGSKGYQKGCRCATCRAGHRARLNAYNNSRR